MAEAPQLLVQGERPGAARHLGPFEPGEDREWLASFTVDAAESAGLRLAVVGGGPFVLDSVELRASTISAGLGPSQ
jgi:hypothetical protein